MRIISKFTDFYDCVQATGQDMGLLYVRNEKTENLTGWPFPSVLSFRDYPMHLKQYIIGFCGKVYPCLYVAYCRNEDLDGVYCYNLAEVDAYVEATFKKRDIEVYRDEEHRKTWRFPGCRRKYIKEFFEKSEKIVDAHAKRFEQHLSPIFLGNLQGGSYRLSQGDWKSDPNQSIVWNASLRDVDFMRVKDPYTAFQEISMYLGNIAFPNRPIPKVSDEILCEAKGFDKYSFRREKQNHPGEKG